MHVYDFKKDATYRALYGFVNETMKPYDASHDIHHVESVVRNVIGIASAHGIVGDTVRATVFTALSHEMCDRKYVKDGEGNLDKIRAILIDHGEKPQVVESVLASVPNISFSKRLQFGVPVFTNTMQSTTYHLVSDGDMLEAMGATGVVRTYMYQAAHGSSMYEAYTHITERLFKCFDHLHFDAAQKEGKRRLERMTRICMELVEERQFSFGT